MSEKKFNTIFIILAILPVIIFYGLISFTFDGEIYSHFLGLSTNRAKTITAPSLPQHQMGGVRFDGASPILASVRGVGFWGDIDIYDTREFMKVVYGANISTYKDVENISEKVKDSIKIYDGRINDYSVSETYGNISFIVPKVKFDDFRKRIQSFTNKNLIIENIRETNQLNQKINLENRGEDLEINQTLVDKYKAEADSARVQMNNASAEVSTIQNQIRKLDPQLSEYQILKNSLNESLQIAQTKVSSYKQNYNLKLSIYNGALENQKNNTKILAQDNTNFDNDIETVDGYISVYSVNIFAYLQKMFPFLYYVFNPIFIYVLFIIIVYFVSRRVFVA